MVFFFCFFFSSRRRHTRYWRDWSSDVCSSDLRHHLLIGEPGVGKRTLLREQFRRAHPQGRITEIDCASFTVDDAPVLERRAHLVLLRSLHLLGPVAARQLDEALRPLLVLPDPPLVV